MGKLWRAGAGAGVGGLGAAAAGVVVVVVGEAVFSEPTAVELEPRPPAPPSEGLSEVFPSDAKRCGGESWCGRGLVCVCTSAGC